MNDLQYLTDSKGVKIAVVIAMEDWEQLNKYIEEVSNLERIGNSIKTGLVQAKKMEANRIAPDESTNNYLDAL